MTHERRVSDERVEDALAGHEHVPDGAGTSGGLPGYLDLARDLCDARARLAAWEPIVKAAAEYRAALRALLDSFVGWEEPVRSLLQNPEDARATLIAAVDDLPQEMKP